MTKAIRIHEAGGPEVLTWEDVGVGSPGEGEVRIRHTSVGLNYIDTYFRSGLYPSPTGELPLTLGNEGAGVVTAVGSNVDNLAVGDRIAYAGPIGSYSEERVIDAAVLVTIPDGVDDHTAAAMMLKGMTARYLLRQTHPLKAGEYALFHAAAGGVGLIAGQWGNDIGATMIGTVSSDEKADLARANGYQYVINYNSEDFVERVKEITDGKGCAVVYDSVGKDTFPASLDCLQPRGMWASFGQSSGPLPDVNLGILAQKGSLFATRPTLFSYIAGRDALKQNADDLFDVVARGAVSISVNQTYPLSQARQAHEDLHARKTTGSTVFTL